MSPAQLSETGSRLVKKYATRNPFEIARYLGIEVKICDNFGPLKGMYHVILRNRYIFLNSELDDNMMRIVCAHEIGHDQLHRSLVGSNGIREFTLYDMKSRPEYEANIVASEILIDTDIILDYIYNYGYTAHEIAQAMNTDINLVALKITQLVSLGYNLKSVDHKSDFLRK